MPIPTEIAYEKSTKILTVRFDDDRAFDFPAEFLRVVSPSAEVQGHSESEKRVVSGRRHVGITAIEPVGQYAVRIVFDDLHDTGLYSWDYLYSLGENQTRVWEDYLESLKATGRSRDP